mmetsp:Transcript_2650/g.3541  ORF Transcript_2650/g.3541 Transcript_2650/m.3541 type:complete len:229 (+) Transcript_2650:114-800(+)
MGQKPGKETKKDPKSAKNVGPFDPETVKRLQEQTNFDKVEVGKLYETFLSLSNGGKQPLDKELFKAGLGKLESCGLKNLDDTPFVDRLFSLLDINHDGTVDLQEFITGLSLLCKGSVEDKLELSFKAYDLDGNGFISKDELAAMFKSAWIAGFRALCATHGNEELSMEDLNEFSEEMATLFADNAFDTLDTNGDGQLSFEEFKEFALAEPKITATLNGFKKEVNITFW